MSTRLVRAPLATVLIGPDRTRVLVPSGRLLTFSGSDAALARRLLEDAAAGIEPPAESREGRVAAALVEHGGLVEVVPEPDTGESAAAPTRVLYCVTGAADAVRAAEFVNALVAEGRFEIQVVLDDEAAQLVNPQGLRWLLGVPVHVGVFDGETAMHSALGTWADVIAVVPAGADFLRRLARGRYSDLVSLVVANSRGRVVLFAAEDPPADVASELEEEGFSLVAADPARRGRVGVSPGELVVALDDPYAARSGSEPAKVVEPLRVVYGISGAVVGVSASAWLEALTRAGFEVAIEATAAAGRMVSEDGLKSVYGHVGPDDPAGLAAWSDVVVVLPAAAELLCRLAEGDRSDRLAATVVDAETVVLVPGMNETMWSRRAVRRAVDALAERGMHVVLPGMGFRVADPAAPAGLGGIGVHPPALPGLLRLVVRQREQSKDSR